MAKTALAVPSIEFEAIDRLEQKVKQLVAVLDRARAETARVADENGRLRGELEAARTELKGSEGLETELSALRGEREQIRSRVDDMLRQIDALQL